MRKSTVLLAIIGLLLIASSVMAARDAGEDWLLTYRGFYGFSGNVNWINQAGNPTTNQYVGAGVITVTATEYLPSTTTVKGSSDIKVFCVDNVTLVSGGDWYKQLIGQKPTVNVPGLSDAGWANKVWLINRYDKRR